MAGKSKNKKWKMEIIRRRVGRRDGQRSAVSSQSYIKVSFEFGVWMLFDVPSKNQKFQLDQSNYCTGCPSFALIFNDNVYLSVVKSSGDYLFGEKS